MTDKKSVLVIGLQPTLIDFSSSDYAAYLDMDAAKVSAGLKAAEDSLTQLGYDVQMCLTDFGETAGGRGSRGAGCGGDGRRSIVDDPSVRDAGEANQDP